MENLARFLDDANHHPNSTPDDIRSLCREVISHGFHAVFVNACYVSLAKETLAGKATVGCVVSFPLGQDDVSAKAAAANKAVSDGADELDVVPNLGLFLAGQAEKFTDEMREVVDAARMPGRPVIVKFILDPGYFDELTDPKAGLAEAARCVQLSGADFVKIGSGMGPRNPTVEDVRTVKAAVPDMKIKAAGGVENREQAEALLEAGADRIGTSHAVAIITGSRSGKKRSGKSSE